MMLRKVTEGLLVTIFVVVVITVAASLGSLGVFLISGHQLWAKDASSKQPDGLPLTYDPPLLHPGGT